MDIDEANVVKIDKPFKNEQRDRFIVPKYKEKTRRQGFV